MKLTFWIHLPGLGIAEQLQLVILAYGYLITYSGTIDITCFSFTCAAYFLRHIFKIYH